MARLFGAARSRRDLETRLGHLSQAAGVRMMRLDEGSERDLRIADVRTGTGLRFQISLDRGMDISAAEFRGIPLAWRSPAGDAHPSYFDPRGTGWTRTFPGGLVTGCGMATAGAASTDDGEDLGLHGRLSMLPATGVRVSEDWEGDECVFRVSGTVCEWTLFREHLVLQRTVEARLGSSLFTIRDRVRNAGSERTPLMMLYHINIGWPVLSEHSFLRLRSRKTEPRDEVAARGLDQAKRFSPPAAGYREQVFFHDLVPGDDGLSAVLLDNPELGLGVGVRFRARELHQFTEWKMMGEGAYVLGVEPGNCRVGGRAAERLSGRLEKLDAGQEKEFFLEIGVVEGKQELQHFTTTQSLA